jgi:hypothetical protein
MSWRPPRESDPADPNDPGWWQASDDRWYPPESNWFPPGMPPASGGKFPTLLVTVVAVTAALGVIIGVILLVHANSGTSSKTSLPTGGPASSAPTPTAGLTPSTRPPLSAVIASRATVVVGPSPGETGPLDVTEAERVTRRLWADHTRARFQRDAPLLKAIEAGPALEADYGSICYLGCRGPDATEARQFVNVPRQTSWPVAFAATVQYFDGCFASQRPCVDTLVLTQQAQDRPWKIAFWMTAAGRNRSPEEFPALSSDGRYAITPGAPRISAQDLLTDYANYLSTLKRTGQPPASTRLAPGAFTSGLAASLYNPLSRQQAFGTLEHVSYFVDPADATWTFATSQNTTMVCGTVRYVATLDGVDGRPIVQPPNFSAFGSDVLPGRYASITQRGLHMVCFGLHRETEPAYVIGTFGEDTTVETKPAR